MEMTNQPELLNTFLEGLGIEADQIDKQALEETLFPSLNHKMYEIIQEAKKLMRHSKRDYLTCQDIKFAIQKLNISQSFGYPSHVPFQY